MSNLGKILVAVVVLIVLVGGFSYLRNKGMNSTDITSSYDSTVVATTTDNTSTITPPEATANIDDAVTAFSQEQTQEASITDTSASDKALVTSDSQIINDTTKTYDETQF